jgi:myo-inositol-1(or 4)-monophosphatase
MPLKTRDMGPQGKGGPGAGQAPEPAQLLESAQLAAERAAAFLREREGDLDPGSWSEKSRADYATEVDREAERIIADTLAESYPDGVVVGEELTPGTGPLDLAALRGTAHGARAPGESSPPSVVWIVDPLDGTTNFLHRYPFYSVSIAGLVQGDLVVGVVHHVSLEIRYHAVRGGGAFQDEHRICVSLVEEPRHALIGTGFPFKRLELLSAYQRQFAAVMSRSAGVRRAGSAALDLADVAAGRFDGFWELMLAPWDLAAGTLLVREAGGAVTGLEGEPTVLRHGAIVAGNPKIHGWLLDTLRLAGAG